MPLGGITCLNRAFWVPLRHSKGLSHAYNDGHLPQRMSGWQMEVVLCCGSSVFGIYKRLIIYVFCK